MSSGLDKYSRTVPGTSFTATPGTENWTNPPKYVTAAEALDHVLDRIIDDEEKQDTAVEVIMSGVPVSQYVQAIKYHGVAENLWNVDIAEAIGPALGVYFADLADQKSGGMPFYLTTQETQPDRDVAAEEQQNMFNMMRRHNPKVAEMVSQEMDRQKNDREMQNAIEVEERIKSRRRQLGKDKSQGFMDVNRGSEGEEA